MPPPNIAKKYAEQFVDTSGLRIALGTDRGTMPADRMALKKLIAQKLSDKKFLEKFVNDCIQTGEVSVRMR